MTPDSHPHPPPGEPAGTAARILGDRLRDMRVLRGLTQDQLAAASHVSVQRIRQIEQGTVSNVHMETLRQLAMALRTTTGRLAGDEVPPEAPHAESAAQFAPIREALFAGSADADPDTVTVDTVTVALRDVQRQFRAGNYTTILGRLAVLASEAFALGRPGRDIRSQVLTLIAWLAVHTHHYELADTVVDVASDDAADMWAAAEAQQIRTWAQTRSGDFAGCYDLAVKWSDDLEPRQFSRAGELQFVAWGHMNLRLAMAAVRNGRPGDADDALRMAAAAAAAIGREVHTEHSFLRPFGPAVVAAKRAELAAVEGKHDKVLALAARIPPAVIDFSSAHWLRHRLDVAAAHTRLGDVDSSVKVMEQLHRAAPWWIGEQPAARLILGDIVSRRRTLTPRIQALAAAVRLPE